MCICEAWLAKNNRHDLRDIQLCRNVSLVNFPWLNAAINTKKKLYITLSTGGVLKSTQQVYFVTFRLL